MPGHPFQLLPLLESAPPSIKRIGELPQMPQDILNAGVSYVAKVVAHHPQFVQLGQRIVLLMSAWMLKSLTTSSPVTMKEADVSLRKNMESTDLDVMIPLHHIAPIQCLRFSIPYDLFPYVSFVTIFTLHLPSCALIPADMFAPD